MREILKALKSWTMYVQFFLGVYCGIPLLLVGGTLQAWMKESGVDLSVIGFFALVGMPWSLKFLWAPFMDRYSPPFLDRRRGWIVVCQALVAVTLIVMSQINPGENTWLMALVCFFLSFFSASQDIVVDAYRRESLSDYELGLGSSFYVNGYRIGMLFSGAMALMLADMPDMDWPKVYLFMAALMGSGIIITLFCPDKTAHIEAPKSLTEAVIGPFKSYFNMKGAWVMLAFILLYKAGDTMAAHMTMPLYLDIGYSKTDIGQIAKVFGLTATIVGGTLGGLAMLRLGINKSLWIFGILQMVSTAGFAVLATMPASMSALAVIIAFENLAGGMGTTAYVAFMASITDKKFTATQYALLTSFMGIPRIFLAAPTGVMAKAMGWESFFIFCTFAAIPGMFLLSRFAPWSGKDHNFSV